MDNVRGDIDVNEEVAATIAGLWKESPIQETFGLRAKLKIHDSSAYFFDEIDRIANRSYIPTHEV